MAKIKKKVITVKIAIIGATGNAGSAITTEADKRGHEVTAFVHSDTNISGIATITKDIFALTLADVKDFDVIINTFANHKQPELILDAATHLIHILRGTPVRAIFMLGAASLINTTGRQLLEDLKQLPESAAWINEPQHGCYELTFLSWVKDVNWIGFSPQSNFLVGEPTAYMLTQGKIVEDAAGQSHVTTGNMALAVLDELETPTTNQSRLSVSDAF